MSILQHASVGVNPLLPRNSTATLTASLSDGVTPFPNPVAAGNAIVVVTICGCNNGNNTGIEVPATVNDKVEDDLGNVYHLVGHLQAGVEYGGGGVYVCYNALPGTPNVKYSIDMQNQNPVFDNAQTLGFIAFEDDQLGALPSLTRITMQQNGTGGAGNVLSLGDSTGTLVTANFGVLSQVPSFFAIPVNPNYNLFVMAVGPFVDHVPPTITPPGYITPVLLTRAVDTNGIEILSVWSSTIGVPIPPPLIACPLATAVVGTPYQSTIPVSVGTGSAPFRFALHGAQPLAPDLGLDPDTGVVSGTPSQIGSFPYSVQVTDSRGETDTINCQIDVSPANYHPTVYVIPFPRRDPCCECPQLVTCPQCGGDGKRYVSGKG